MSQLTKDSDFLIVCACVCVWGGVCERERVSVCACMFRLVNNTLKKKKKSPI